MILTKTQTVGVGSIHPDYHSSSSDYCAEEQSDALCRLNVTSARLSDFLTSAKVCDYFYIYLPICRF